LPTGVRRLVAFLIIMVKKDPIQVSKKAATIGVNGGGKWGGKVPDRFYWRNGAMKKKKRPNNEVLSNRIKGRNPWEKVP